MIISPSQPLAPDNAHKTTKCAHRKVLFLKIIKPCHQYLQNSRSFHCTCCVLKGLTMCIRMIIFIQVWGTSPQNISNSQVALLSYVLAKATFLGTQQKDIFLHVSHG